MARQIILAVGQIAPKVEDVAGNAVGAIVLIEQAAGQRGASSLPAGAVQHRLLLSLQPP